MKSDRRAASVVHLSSLVVNILRLGVLNVVVTFSIRHWLVQICLVLSLLHMKREVLVVAIHVGGVGVWDNLIDGNWALDCFVLLIEDLGNIALEFVALRLHIFDGEADHCASDLYCHCVLRLQPQLLFQQDDRAELRSVVLNIEAVMLAFDVGVTATNTDVVDTHLTLVSTT